MTQYTARITGEIWWPMGAKAATDRTYFADDDEHAVDKVLMSESGDFSAVDDFEVVRLGTASCGHSEWETIKAFETEDGEFQYMDCFAEEYA